MKNKLFIIMATVGVSVLTFIATAMSANACLYAMHQPVEPKALCNE